MMTIERGESERRLKELREYILGRDRGVCQWPGCTSISGVGVLFIAYTDTNVRRVKRFDNGISLCGKHKEIVFLDESIFAPFLAELIKLVEFQRDIERIEVYIRKIAQEKYRA